MGERTDNELKHSDAKENPKARPPIERQQQPYSDTEKRIEPKELPPTGSTPSTQDSIMQIAQ